MDKVMKYILDNKERLKKNSVDEISNFLKGKNKAGESRCEVLSREGFFDEISKDINQPLIFDGKLQPVFSLNEIILEKVYVETDLDTDNDGKKDLIAVYIKRPKETLNGMKVPANYIANPYMMSCIEDVYENRMYNVDRDLIEEKLSIRENKKNSIENRESYIIRESKGIVETSFIEVDGVELECLTDWYEYFLSRGIAAVFSAGTGTLDSEGINCTGSNAEKHWVISVIEWLNGKRRAFTDKENGIEIKATWCNGSVAMSGKSYLGTLSIAAAVTGVEGLKTIIPEAAISNWYNYYRMNGVTAAPLGWQGDDIDLLTDYCRSRIFENLEQKDLAKKISQNMREGANREGGEYNSYWNERNYLLDVEKIKCSVFIIHGLNDWNVKTNQCFKLWEELKRFNIPTKILLHQGDHVYVSRLKGLEFYEIMNLWLTYWLYGVQNNVLEKIPDILIQGNLELNKWRKKNDDMKIKVKKYGISLNQKLALEKDNQGVSKKIVKIEDDIQKLGFSRELNNFEKWQKNLVLGDNKQQKIVYLTDCLEKDLEIFGKIKVSLKVIPQQTEGLMSVMLVDYGYQKRITTNQKELSEEKISIGRDGQLISKFVFEKEKKESEYRIISRGHMNLRNIKGNDRKIKLEAKKEYECEIEMIPTYYMIPKGNRIGLVLYGTDVEITQRPLKIMSYKIDESYVKLKIETF